MAPTRSRLARVAAHLAAATAMAVLLAAQAAPVAAQNLLTNTQFDTGLDGWLVLGQGSCDPKVDFASDPRSGSAKGVFDSPAATGADGIVEQCVPVTVGVTYVLGGEIILPDGNTASGGAYFLVVPFPTKDCSGPPPPAGPAVQTPEITAVGNWNASATTFRNSFAQSVEFWAVLAPESGGRLQANYDNVFFGPGTLGCSANGFTLCLLGRFEVTATFDTGNGKPSSAFAVPLDPNPLHHGGYFWFFDAGNVEVLVKMLDGCSLGGHFWFFAAGLTNVQVTITVQDTQTGTTQVYTNPAHTAFQPIQDTRAFACP